MVTTLDIRPGQRYTLRLPEQEPMLATFRKEMDDGRFAFSRDGTEYPIYLPEQQFIEMALTGDAVEVLVNGHGEIMPERDLDPTSLLDPNEPSITLRERDQRLRAIEKLKKARTLRFYVTRMDEHLSLGRGKVAINRFIAANYRDALEKELDWRVKGRHRQKHSSRQPGRDCQSGRPQDHYL